MQPVECEQRRRRVAAPAAESRAVRDVLRQRDAHVRLDPAGAAEKARGADDEIVLAGRQRRVVADKLQPARRAPRDLQGVAERHRTHQRFQIVKTIRPPPEHAALPM